MIGSHEYFGLIIVVQLRSSISEWPCVVVSDNLSGRKAYNAKATGKQKFNTNTNVNSNENTNTNTSTNTNIDTNTNTAVECVDCVVALNGFVREKYLDKCFPRLALTRISRIVYTFSFRHFSSYQDTRLWLIWSVNLLRLNSNLNVNFSWTKGNIILKKCKKKIFLIENTWLWFRWSVDLLLCFLVTPFSPSLLIYQYIYQNSIYLQNIEIITLLLIRWYPCRCKSSSSLLS